MQKAQVNLKIESEVAYVGRASALHNAEGIRASGGKRAKSTPETNHRGVLFRKRALHWATKVYWDHISIWFILDRGEARKIVASIKD